MKKRKIMLFMIHLMMVFTGICVLAAVFSYTKDILEIFFVAISLCVLGIAMMIVFFLLASNPSKEIAQRWKSYSALIARGKTGTYGNAAQESSSVDGDSTSNVAIDYKLELERTRQNYKNDTDKYKNRIENPNFSGFKPFCDRSVLQDGKIYYGCVVAANEEIYENRKYRKKILPGVMIYSTDEYYESNPEELAVLAKKMFRGPNNILSNQEDAFSTIKIQNETTAGRPIYMITFLGYRYHLPFGYLLHSTPICPIIADPFNCQSAFIVDSKYWSNGFLPAYFGLNKPQKTEK